MTQMAMHLSYPAARCRTTSAPLRWRLRGAAMTAAFVLGAGAVSLPATIGYGDRGVAQAPATVAGTANATASVGTIAATPPAGTWIRLVHSSATGDAPLAPR